MTSEKNKSSESKVRLPLAPPTDAEGNKRTYGEIMDGNPSCGDCMWLLLRRPSEVSACDQMELPDGSGGTIRITATSEPCKYFTEATAALEAMYKGFMAMGISDLREARKMITPIIREKEAEVAEQNPVGVKDIVKYTLTEGDEINVYKGVVTERGRSHIIVARKSPTDDDPDHMELDKLPLNLATLQIVRSAAVEAVGEGINKHNRSAGDPEQIRKVKIRRAKRMKSVIDVIAKCARKTMKKRAPLSEILEASSLEEDVVKDLIADLRSFKMAAKIKGKFKLTEFGEHCLSRLKKSTDVTVTWYKLENRARKNNGEVVASKPEVVDVVKEAPKTAAPAPSKKRILTLVR